MDTLFSRQLHPEDGYYEVCDYVDGDAIRLAEVFTQYHARLFAAAPDLLAALEAMITRYGWGHNEADPEMKQARAAIAKATTG